MSSVWLEGSGDGLPPPSSGQGSCVIGGASCFFDQLVVQEDIREGVQEDDRADDHVDDLVEVVARIDVLVDLVEPLGRHVQARIEDVSR